MNRILEIDEAESRRRRRAQRRHRRPAGRGRACRPVLSARSGIARGSRSIGGNVAECAGGPRAFKYGTTKRYVLGLQAVLPTGEIIDTGGKVVKNVVGYDLTQLLVGSEGTLAIITRDHPAAGAKAARAVHAARDVSAPCRTAVQAVTNIMRDARRAGRARVDRRRFAGGGGAVPRTSARWRRKAPARCSCSKSTASPRPSVEEAARVERACRDAGATEVLRARRRGVERQELWRVRRETLALAENDRAAQVQPRRRRAERPDPAAVRAGRPDLQREYRLRIPCFGHAGDGNIHVNIMVTPGDDDEMRARARGRARAVRRRGRARGLDQRRARHRLRQGAVHAARAVARRDRADEARQSTRSIPTGF